MTKKPILLTVLLLIALMLCFLIPFRKQLDFQLPVTIYESDGKERNSSVSIQGTVTKRLLTEKQVFTGTFSPEGLCDLPTGAQASIEMQPGQDFQTLIFYFGGGPYDAGIDSRILTDRQLSQVAFCLTDGTIAASSREMYEAYLEIQLK